MRKSDQSLGISNIRCAESLIRDHSRRSVLNLDDTIPLSMYLQAMRSSISISAKNRLALMRVQGNLTPKGLLLESRKLTSPLHKYKTWIHSKVRELT